MMNRRAFLAGSAATLVAGTFGCASAAHRLTVGSKNFTEQVVLGELLAQLLERSGEGLVDRRFYLAGSYICHQALLAGRIDMYVEYTGTALTAILKDAPNGDHEQVFERVKSEYARRFGLEVMPSLGFDNTFAMAMRGEQARSLGLRRLTDLARVAPQLRLGVGYEFLERPDGFPGLAKTYGLRFAEAPRVMDLGLLYRALQAKQVDVVAGSNTDGLIAALGLVVLEDDRHYFPPYDAVPIVRRETLERHPAAGKVFKEVAGRLTADTMRHLNYAIDGEKKDVTVVVREFVAKNLEAGR
jgi:osmoprotectant transport system substrate-binding protein